MDATKIRPAVITLALAAVFLTIAAGLLLFSTLMAYDDEGYVLFSLKNFHAHGGLYREVYSQYGPFPHVLYDRLHSFGLPFTHNAGRLITLACWAGAALFSMGAVWRGTRNFAASLFTLAAVFAYLWVMGSEPLHPGGLVALLTALLAAIGGDFLRKDRLTTWALLAGAGGATLLLIKINVGIFALIPAAVVFSLNSHHSAVHRWSPWVLAGGLAALPFVLMRNLLNVPWVLTYAVVFALAAVPAVGAASRLQDWSFGRRHLLGYAGGAVAIILAVLGPILFRGTSPVDLLEGILLGPLRHPVSFSIPFHWPDGSIVLAILSCGLFGGALALARSGRRRLADATVACLRLGGTAALALAFLAFPNISPDRLVFALAAPCLWLFVWPLGKENVPANSARIWIGFLFLGQWLHAYPVPGSQMAWGSFLAIPLAMLGAVEAARWLVGNNVVSAGLNRLGRIALPTLLSGVALWSGLHLARIGARYFHSRSLGLAGAELIRAPDGMTAICRIFSLNASAHADVLFSLPGMFSFNLWAGLPAPTLANVTHWFSLLSEERQQAIITALEAHPHACVIVEKENLRFLKTHGISPKGALYDYIQASFQTAFSIDNYDFLVRKDRRIAPFSMASIYPAANPDPGVPDTLLEMTLLLPAGEEIGRVEITVLDARKEPLLVLDAGSAKAEIQPVNSRGEPVGSAVAARFPLKMPGPAKVSLFFDRSLHRFSLKQTLIVVRGTDGAELGLLMLQP